MIGASQPLVERDARFPADFALGERRIDDAAALLAGLRRTVYRLDCLAPERDALRGQGHDVGLSSGADVHRADEGALETAEVGPHEIFDEHVVAGLLAVTVDPWRLAA